jgi:ABC-type uncharacterized transport system auxiliary subunit
MKQHIFMLICLVMIVNACSFSIKSEYPEIKYYDMTDNNLSSKKIENSIPYSIYIRPFSSLSQFDTDQMIEKRDGNKIHRFYYHRWIEDFSDLFRNITIAELKRSEIAGKGVVDNALMFGNPELIIDAQILDAMAYNIDETDNYSVVLEIEFTVSKYAENNQTNILLKKIYKESVKRNGSEAATINSAFAVASNNIISQLLDDLTNLK